MNTLRGIPEQQATNYNDYLIASTKIRQRVELDGDARVFQISRLALAAQVQNQSLLDTANANDARLQAIVAPSTDASEAALSKVRWIYSLGLSLQAICIQLVSDG